jgi:hypothetical protein
VSILAPPGETTCHAAPALTGHVAGLLVATEVVERVTVVDRFERAVFALGCTQQRGIDARACHSLFEGQSREFFAKVMALAEAADAAQRRI